MNTQPPITDVPRWHIIACLGIPLALLGSLVLLDGRIFRALFHLLQDNLPLTLPILTVAMSLALNPRGLGRIVVWLEHTQYFSLGLVSFSIWYLVASQSVSEYILISHERVLIKDHALLLTILAFIWAGFCSVVSVMAETAEPAKRARWLRARLVILSLSVVGLFLPWALIQDKADVEKELGRSLDVRTFSVAIPYKDPSFNQYLGRSANPILQVASYTDVQATTASAAIDSARARFLGSPASRQWSARSDSNTRPVEIVDSRIVAQEMTGPTALLPPN